MLCTQTHGSPSSSAIQLPRSKLQQLFRISALAFFLCSGVIKERLEDLRKEKKLSFEQLSKQLAERGTIISHTNLKNYEINDPVHSLYGRTKSMSIEYLVAFADFYDVSVEYLLGLSNSRKREYHDISEQLGLCDGAIAELLQCKENSGSEEDFKMYAQQDTAILNDFLTSMEFEIVMEKIKQHGV